MRGSIDEPTLGVPAAPLPHLGPKASNACDRTRPALLSRLRRSRPVEAAVALLVAVCCAAAGSTAHAATALPDLIVDSLSVAPGSGPNGTSVQITATIRNQGDAPAVASKTRIRINTDPTGVLPTDTALCNSLATPALNAGDTAEVTCMPALMARPPGANYIWAIADAGPDVTESNEDNNKINQPFTINDQVPDLIVQSIAVNPDSVSNGEAPDITIVIKNQGTSLAAASIARVRINQNATGVAPEDDQVCGSVSTPSIAAGQIATVHCKSTISGRPAGTNYVWVIADVNNDSGESNHDNDRASALITISAAASDIVVDSIVLNPTGGANGSLVQITITVRNQGTGPSFDSTTKVRINQNPDDVAATDPIICGSLDTPAIPVGSTTVVSCKPTLNNRPAGTNYIWVILDSSNTAGQADRTNDRSRADYEVAAPPAPDMAVTQVTVKPTSAANGTLITVSARVENDGKANSPVTETRFLVNQNADGVSDGDLVLCDNVDTLALAPGASLNVNCKPTLSGLAGGSYFIWALADITGVSGQSNHNNDMLSVPFTVLTSPVPDLVVDSVAATPSSGNSGTMVTVTAKVHNVGTAAAAASTARFQLSASSSAVLATDPVVCNSLTPSLATGVSSNVNCTWTVNGQAPGPMFLWVTADQTNTAGQTNRTNDTNKTAFTVAAASGPDLVVKRVVVLPSTARSGTSVLVRARIANVGNVASAASVTTFRINQNTSSVSNADAVLCAAKPTAALLPGTGVRVRCTATIGDLPLGANQVWVTADTTATSGQTNTGNDSGHATLTVTDAACTDPNAAPVFGWPVEQPRILQDYASYGSVPLGAGKVGYHSGIDLLSQLSIPADQTPVYAAADGEVVAIRRGCPSPADPVVNPPSGTCAGGWGNFVVIRHGDGIYSVYSQLGDVLAKNDTCVTRGDRIALAGSSGATNIPVHLHFDVLANLVEPVPRAELGMEYYRKYYPYAGRTPEIDTGALQTHLDARDFMPRIRIGITAATAASRDVASGAVVARLAKGQQYISYGQLVPGFYLIDLPNPMLPEDGPPYGDGVRYGWVPAASVQELETAPMPTSSRIDGFGVFSLEGAGPNFVVVRDQPSATSAEVTKVWADQQFAPAGAPVPDLGAGGNWQPIYVSGTTTTGSTKPRVAYVPVVDLGPPPGH
ncbi:MAG TPA: CARDB domain-containing protein [Candidatus Binatia bacterium]|jgi:subtilase family serine protease